MNYEGMSYDELEKLNQELTNERDGIREQQRQIAAAMDKKAVFEEAKRKAETMSGAEKAALLQIIGPQGIASEENVNEG